MRRFYLLVTCSVAIITAALFLRLGVLMLAPHDSYLSVNDVPPYALQTAPPYTVALDAGHGGYDSGGKGFVHEIEMTENTVNALYALLENDANFMPVLCRAQGENASRTARAEAANAAHASLMLSIHGNEDRSNASSYGFECFPTPPGRYYHADALRFAHCLTEKMGEAGHRLRGETGVRYLYYNGKSKKMVEESDSQVRESGTFGVIEKAACPAVLLEQCFLTNQKDYQAWATPEGCIRAARVYYEAICAYFGTPPVALTIS